MIHWIFRRFLETLRHTTIYKKKHLRLPQARYTIYGLQEWKHADNDTDDQIIIWLNPSKRPTCPLSKILVHELAHAIFRYATEREICHFEEFIFRNLTTHQITQLKSFIPKHYVKKRPE